jgi:hypothetical protein
MMRVTTKKRVKLHENLDKAIDCGNEHKLAADFVKHAELMLKYAIDTGRLKEKARPTKRSRGPLPATSAKQ